MFVWVLPGWEEAHPNDVLQTHRIAPSTLLANMGPVIMDAWNKVKRSTAAHQDMAVVAFPKMPDYKIEFSKPKAYSPTFLESMKVAKRTMHDVLMVTDKCPIHGSGETVARFYEMDNANWEYVDNPEVRTTVVDPMLARLGKDSEQGLLFQMMWYTGMRLEQVGKVKVDDIGRMGHDFSTVRY